MPKVRLTVLFAVLSVTMLSACSSGSDALSDVRGRPNSFPQGSNSLNDFDTGSTGDSDNASGLASNEIRVTVEVPTSVAPEGELTRRNLRIVEPDRIQVYETDSSLRELSSVDVDIRSEDDGRRVITFNDGLPIGPNVIVKAYVGNTIIRSLVADDDRDVKINPFSEYLVNNGLGGYTTEEFQLVMDCVNSESDSLCLNKYVWSTLNDQIHDFEIDIPDNYSVAQAVANLAIRPDFATYVANMADYALLDAASTGSINASSVDFNTVLLGLELGQSFDVESPGNSGLWGIRIAQEERLEDSNGVAYVYPGMTLANFDIFNIRVTSIASDVPYNRETLKQAPDNTFSSEGSETWSLNAHTAAPGASTLQDNLRLVTGRALYQSITGRDSSNIIGWTRNPFYLDAYVGGGDAPVEVLAGYFSAGNAIKLTESGNDLKREKTLENHYLSVFEFNLAQSDGFSLSTLGGKTYNVVGINMTFADSGNVMNVESDVGTWAVSNDGTVLEALGYQALTRQASDATISTTAAVRSAASRTISLRTSHLTTGDKDTGRLNLSVGDGDTGNIIGASSPDGGLLAFNLDDVTERGDGLIIAAPQATGAAPDTGSYRLQGFSLGLDTNINHLTHFQNSVLTLSPGSATLQLEGLEVVHTVSPLAVTAPGSVSQTINLTTYTDSGNGQLTLTDGNLFLTGFVTEDREKLILRVVDNSSPEKVIGLAMATKLP